MTNAELMRLIQRIENEQETQKRLLEKLKKELYTSASKGE